MKEEELLIQKAKKGDDVSFGKLYDTYLPSIYRFVFLKIGRKEDAEDITQKVFVSAWENLKKFEYKGFPLSSWLYRIASNAVIDYYRTWKGNVSIDLVSEEYFSEFRDEEGKIDDSFDIARIRTAVAQLEQDQQNVVIMKFVNDLSNKEIAESLGKTEGAIRVIQHRALKQLKNIIEADAEHHHTTIKEA